MSKYFLLVVIVMCVSLQADPYRKKLLMKERATIIYVKQVYLKGNYEKKIVRLKKNIEKLNGLETMTTKKKIKLKTLMSQLGKILFWQRYDKEVRESCKALLWQEENMLEKQHTEEWRIKSELVSNSLEKRHQMKEVYNKICNEPFPKYFHLKVYNTYAKSDPAVQELN